MVHKKTIWYCPACKKSLILKVDEEPPPCPICGADDTQTPAAAQRATDWQQIPTGGIPHAKECDHGL